MPSLPDKFQTEDSTRAIAVTPKSLNIETRTVTGVLATEDPVEMYDYRIGPYLEVLSMNPEHIRQGRLDKGINVLDNHNRYSNQAVIGKVDTHEIKGKKLYGGMRFSKRKDVDEGAWVDIQDSILTNISLGYRVFKYQDMNPKRSAEELPILKAIDWEPREVSFTAVQADENSRTRSSRTEHEVEILTENTNMPKEEEGAPVEGADNTRKAPVATPTPVVENAPVLDADKLRSEGTLAERTRASQIRDAVRSAKLDDKFAEDLIIKGDTIDQARAAIIEKFAEADPNDKQRNVVITEDEKDKTRAIGIDALLTRAGHGKMIDPELQKDRERQGRIANMTGLSLKDMARLACEDMGLNTRNMSMNELITRAITSSTSDFPILLEGAARTVLLDSYGNVPDTWREFCKVGSVSDFRPHHRIRNGTLSRLDRVPENAEYINKPITDAEKESIEAETFGNTINISRKMIINDNLGGFLDLVQRLGRACARGIEIDVFALLASNPIMGDGVALFDAAHGNIGAGGATTTATMDALRQLMALQKDKDSNDYLNLRPAILLSSIARESGHKLINDAQYDPSVSNKTFLPNICRNMFKKVIGSPRLSGNPFYLFADPNEEPTLEVVFLNGEETPFMDQQEGFRVDGMEWKIRHDYGVGAVGWRGALKDAGQ